MAKKSSAQTAGKKKDSKINSQSVNNSKKAESKESKKTKTVEKESNKEKEEVKVSEVSIEDQLKDIQDKYLRLSAEFDNYRKRTLKEKADLLKSAGESTIMKFIPVMDDFDRAMGSIEDAKDTDAVKKGIELIFNKLKDTFSQQGVKEIDAMHKDFDTDLHEAVTKIPAPEKKLSGKVVDVIEKGYYLNDKVIRFSKVVIGE